MPIKAAEKDASCSMFRDPLVTKFFNVVVEGSPGQLAEEIMLNTCRRIKVEPVPIQWVSSFDKSCPESVEDFEIPTILYLTYI